MRRSQSYFSTLLLILAATGLGSAIELDAAEFAKQKFDFIVCGGGTAGTAVATRLSEIAGWKVGLIEAGLYHKDDPAVLIPQGWNVGKTWGNAVSHFATTPQKALNGRKVPMARGKGLGGSSMINLMGFLRAGAVEYDQIGELGNPGWSWKNILPYFMKAETVHAASPELQNQTHATIDPTIRGHTGPVHTSFSQWFSEAIPPFFDAMINLGFEAILDGGDGTDADYVWNPILAINQDTEERSYAANAYYEPNAGRDNLILLTGAQVIKVELSGTADKDGNLRATGVTYVDTKNKKSYTASASMEVVLSSGAIQSPQLLELSGIGNKELLTKFGIETRVDLPAVGENYQDHLMVFETYEIPNTIVTWDILNDPEKNATAYAQYLKNHTGIYTAGVTAISYISAGKFIDADTLNEWVQQLDKDFNATNPSVGARAQYEVQRKRLSPTSKEATLELYAAPSSASPDLVKPNSSYVQVVAIPSHQFSRGSIHIQSSDPLAEAAIDLNTWALDIDRKVMLAGAKFARQVTDTLPFSRIITQPIAPPQSNATDDQWLDFIRNTASNSYHPCCTASMLPKHFGGVVDPTLKVYGTSNIRVIDVSILPMVLGTHLMGTAYAVAEQGADIIKAAYGKL
ncbi:alcohol oxidase [Auricularia subglabra TFB-10046 SS5]|nr:alcohol oxidase [Auricularia subglabra TFB-10046 SS5]